MAIIEILTILAAFLLAAFPLHFTVTLLGGNSSLLKVILINIFIGFLTTAINNRFAHYTTLITLVAILLIYKVMFELSWLKAVLALVLQSAVVVILLFLAKVLLGIVTLKFF